MTGMTWDAETNERLLLPILSVHDVKVDFAAVAEYMGPQCTKRAVQEQLKKLRKSAAAEQPGTSTSSATQAKTTKASATKASSAKTAKATAAAAAKAKLVSAGKAKKATTPKAPAAKKQRVTKGTPKTPKTPNDTEASNVTDEGNLCDDEATPSTNTGTGLSNVHNQSALHLAEYLLGATKRKRETTDDEDDKPNAEVEEEHPVSENDEDHDTEDDAEEEGPTNEELWNEISQGM